MTREENDNLFDHLKQLAKVLVDTLGRLCEVAIHDFARLPHSLVYIEKVQLVHSLDYQGAFLIRGAVEFVAKALGVSKFTVYNYLKEVRSG